jgi:hypothetical protein
LIHNLSPLSTLQVLWDLNVMSCINFLYDDAF